MQRNDIQLDTMPNYVLGLITSQLTIHDVYRLYNTNNALRQNITTLNHIGIEYKNEFYSYHDIFKQLSIAFELRNHIQTIENTETTLKQSCLGIMTSSEMGGINDGCCMSMGTISTLSGIWACVGTPALFFCTSPATATQVACTYGVGVGIGGLAGGFIAGACGGYAIDQFYRVTGLRVKDKVDILRQERAPLEKKHNHIKHGLWNTVKNKKAKERESNHAHQPLIMQR